MLIVNGLGNFTNSYTEYDGDASALIEIYFDCENKSIMGTSIIPLYAQCLLGKTHRALPIYDLLTNPDLNAQISTAEFKRIKQVHATITEVMLGQKLPIEAATPRYYKTREGFRQDPAPAYPKPEDFVDTKIYQWLSAKQSVCFVGDSITAGSKNGGIGWYQPLASLFDSINITEKAYDSGVVQTLLNRAEIIANVGAEGYVIAIGTNDVCYRNPAICAMTPEQYIERISELINHIHVQNRNTDFVFVAPWLALTNDRVHRCKSLSERDALLLQYSDALSAFCKSNGYLYVNPNPFLKATLERESTEKYLLDHIHPNRVHGVNLYTKAVMIME
ncbi:hypothetical protein FACS189418_3270 [Clostridia bacterium]|nr:hypothetical protein FACS189418_3270 [Clostridia bacterium]